MAVKKTVYFILKLVLGIVIFFGILEISARFIWKYNVSLREVMRSAQDPKIIFELNPGTKTIFTGQHVKIPPTTIKVSSAGIRDREYSFAKPEGVYRIVILGDSISFGWGVEMEQAFPELLEGFLNERDPGRYEVINFSVPGYNFSQEVATLERKCLGYHPDLVIFSVCGNDYQIAFNYLHPIPILEKIPGIFYQSRLFSGVIGEIVFRKDVSSSRKISEGREEMKRAILELKKIISANDIKVLFYHGDNRYIEDLLVDAGFGSRIFTSAHEVFSEPCYLIENDRHFNYRGHKRVAEDIYGFLKDSGYLKAGEKAFKKF
ncbi:MAG: GDSL-type esterase/lipase family protein [Candidatus Omnitrophica bacterium]|jgi:lysophospholipase L1-like esterase|nr:GDSL-type esterase/lipase family protein [Candidatus Omnitrophota bacterium]